MKKILAAVFCSTLIVACSDDPNVAQFKDSGTTTSGDNLVDHGGKTLPTSSTYAIWWGNQSDFPADAQSGLDSLFEGMTGSSFLGISSQYMRGSAPASTFHTNWTDTSAPPNQDPSISTIVNEACKVLTANGTTPDTDGIYFVYTSNPSHDNRCAWHNHGTCKGVDIQVAYMPSTTGGVAECDPGNLYNCNSYSQGTRSLANVTSHEFMETITNADLSAWYDSSDSEIADKCAWNFSSCVTLTNGSWQLQEEWDNATSSCVQQ